MSAEEGQEGSGRVAKREELMKLINVIYRDYIMSGAALKLIKQRSESTWQKRESETAVERWLQTSANKMPIEARSHLAPGAKSLIWAAAIQDMQAFEKLRSEMEHKGFGNFADELLALARRQIDMEMGVLVDNYSPPVIKMLDNRDRTSGHQSLVYGKWRAKITPRMEYLLANHGVLEVIASKMLYDAMFPRGSSWSLPKPYFEVLSRPPAKEKRSHGPDPFSGKGGAEANDSWPGQSAAPPALQPFTPTSPARLGKRLEAGPKLLDRSRERDLSGSETPFPDGYPVFLYDDRPWDFPLTPRALSPVLAKLVEPSASAGCSSLVWSSAAPRGRDTSDDPFSGGAPAHSEQRSLFLPAPAAPRSDDLRPRIAKQAGSCSDSSTAALRLPPPKPIAKWTEGFSNPFNSTLIEFGHNFCSLWPVVDAHFGGRVGFFDLPTLAGSNWCLNPPFIESVLAETATRIYDFYCAPGPHPEKILLLAPRWRDAKFYEIILQLGKVVDVLETERTLTGTGCRDSFLQIHICSECPILEFKIGCWGAAALNKK